MSFAASIRPSAACQFVSKRFSRAMRAGRERHGCGQRGGCDRRRVRAAAATAAAPAATGSIGVVARQRRAIEGVALHDHPHLALRRGEQRREVEGTVWSCACGLKVERTNELLLAGISRRVGMTVGLLKPSSLLRLAAEASVVLLMTHQATVASVAEPGSGRQIR